MSTTTYRWNGRYQRGAMATRRGVKRAEAEERNSCPQRKATRPSCGHNHSGFRNQGEAVHIEDGEITLSGFWRKSEAAL